MNTRTKLIIVRHGQSIGNLTRTFLGHTDLDLSEMGYLQANATAEALKDEKIDKIYSSDLKRAYNTAKSIANSHKLDIICNGKLREAFAGEWENQNVDHMIAHWGADFFVTEWKNGFGTFTLPGGESIRGAGERFFEGVREICEQNKGKTLVISSHAAVIRAFWGIISDVEWNRLAAEVPFPTNASYSVVYYENGVFTPIQYSIDEHLHEVGITKVNLI